MGPRRTIDLDSTILSHRSGRRPLYLHGSISWYKSADESRSSPIYGVSSEDAMFDVGGNLSGDLKLVGDKRVSSVLDDAEVEPRKHLQPQCQEIRPARSKQSVSPCQKRT